MSWRGRSSTVLLPLDAQCDNRYDTWPICRELRPRDWRRVLEIVQQGLIGYCYAYLLGDLYFLYAPKGFFAACKTVKTYTEQFVKDALQQDRANTKKSDKYTFITDLYSEHHQDTRLVRDQVINVLIAGRDTTAATMSYVL